MIIVNHQSNNHLCKKFVSLEKKHDAEIIGKTEERFNCYLSGT